ncbi:E3 ubiquitin-protein ligase RHA1B [Striga hermonthica]|uniref:E3 ubiquitin-protein ligase RHA1B n=1 Tax=Striga hermonthica TaxID=68872 RepID=A0A9N7RNE4_STRHE|nr:E3 ubiquitin-protein ligase RHA1B [Striga hermonthica]
MVSLYLEIRLLPIIFYSFVWAPLMYAAQTVLGIQAHPNRKPRPGKDSTRELNLLVAGRFCDLMKTAGDESCSICLTEFLGEDMANKLPRCGHVFHVACIERWVETGRLTCPLCRSSSLPRMQKSSYSAFVI